MMHQKMETLSKQRLLKRIEALNIWKKNGQRAPHKPLLILYALAKFQNEGMRKIHMRWQGKILNSC